MAEYIERKAVGNRIRFQVFRCNLNTEEAEKLKALLSEIPSADVAPVVHSKWICCDYDDAEWVCMNCKESVELADAMVDPVEDAKLYYCPNCGAKMDLEGE